MSNKRLELQGLRAIAVLAVMIFHLNADWLPGGYLGVDVFFVLSGYLMALVLTRYEHIGWGEIKGFYARRLARIVPAAFVVAAVAAPFALYVLLPFDMRDFSASLVGLVTGILNIMVANNIGYFSPLADSQPLLHYWSLMVELHFYLLIPLVFWLAARFKLPLTGVIVLLTVISLGYADYRVGQSPNDAYYLLASRAWEFLVGVLLFLGRDNLRTPQLDWITPWIGLVIVTWGFVFFDSSYQHPSLFTTFFIFGVLLLMRLSSSHPLVSLLSSRPLVYLGDISYSVYLWHNVLIVLLVQKVGELNLLHASAVFVLTLLLAHMTRTYIELPFLKAGPKTSWKKGRGPRFYAPLILFFIVFGGYGFDTKGYSGLWKTRVSDASVQAYELYMGGKNYREVDAESECFYRFGSVETADLDRVRGCSSKYGRGVLVLGDSHSIGVFRALNWARMEEKLNAPFVTNLSKGGCGVTTEKRDCFFHQLRADSKWISENYKTVIYVQRGTGLLKSGVEPHQVLDNVKGDAVLEFLSPLAKSIEVIWLGPRIEANRYVSRYVSAGCDHGIEPDKLHGEKLKRLNRELAVKTASSNMSFIDAENYDFGAYGDCEKLYWRDADHWTKQGVKEISAPLSRLLGFGLPTSPESMHKKQ